MPDKWQTFRVAPDEGEWEPANYNVRDEDGSEYSGSRRVLRQHRHGLTVISRYKAPPHKAWKIVGKASTLGEEVYIMERERSRDRGAWNLHVQRARSRSWRHLARSDALYSLL
jgi:hypothetical protein